MMNKRLKDNPLISIAIPLYNGADTISTTLESILKNNLKNIEIVLCDDNSSDNTHEIAMHYSGQFDFIKVFRNNQNIGMDRNFLKTAVLSSGEYIWFFGQDDEVYTGAIERVYEVINRNKDIGVLYLNYNQYNHDMTKIVNESYVKIKDKGIQTYLINKNEYKFLNYRDYFRYINDIPSFLPATIVKSDYIRNNDLKPFYGTNYIQVGMMYLNMHKGSLYLVMDPMIKGRIPNNKWQNDGQYLFKVMTGFLKMQKIALNAGAFIPKRIHRSKKIYFLLNYFFLIRFCKTRGMETTNENLLILKNVFGGGLIFKYYLKPILYMQKEFLNFFYLFLLPLKRLILLPLKLKKIFFKFFNHSLKII